MANYNGDVGTYSHEEYTGLNEQWINVATNPGSVTNFAHFGSRNKILIRAAHVFVRSAASAAGGSLHVMRSTVTIASVTLASATTVGTYHCLTCTTLNTLATIAEQVSMRSSGNSGGGKYDVCYEYQVLYPSTFIGS